MELHKELIIDKNKYNISLADDYLTYFSKAREFVLENYRDDYDRIANTKFEDLTPEFMFREYIWCVLTSGFNAKIISNLYPKLIIAFHPLIDMINGKIDNVDTANITTNAMNIFANKRKIKAIIDTAFLLKEKIKNHGWQTYKQEELSSPDKLESLPFIGKITKHHLARNLGHLDFVKWDLHLVRLSNLWQFENPDKLCAAIKKEYDLPLGLIDLILFYAASTFGSKQNK